jgi:hypothetical protein
VYAVISVSHRSSQAFAYCKANAEVERAVTIAMKFAIVRDKHRIEIEQLCVVEPGFAKCCKSVHVVRAAFFCIGPVDTSGHQKRTATECQIGLCRSLIAHDETCLARALKAIRRAVHELSISTQRSGLA